MKNRSGAARRKGTSRTAIWPWRCVPSSLCNGPGVTGKRMPFDKPLLANVRVLVYPRWLQMLLAFAWKTYLLGVITTLLLVAAVLGALGQIGAALRWVRQRFWPSPPARIKFKVLGARLSRSIDINNRFVGWDYVLPDCAVRNDGPSALYELEVGAEDPRGTGERVSHPQRVQRLGADGTEHRLGGSDGFQIPSEWLDGYDGQEPHKQVAYFIAATDEDGRRWEATCRADPA